MPGGNTRAAFSTSPAKQPTSDQPCMFHRMVDTNSAAPAPSTGGTAAMAPHEKGAPSAAAAMGSSRKGSMTMPLAQPVT